MVRVFIVLAAILAVAYGFQIRKTGRILGGDETDISIVPHMVSMRLGNDGHVCGGSIISEEWALTSAQCVDGTEAATWSLRVGSSIQYTGGSLHAVSQIIKHPQYNKQDYDYDYALVKVATPFEFSDNVKNIGLADVDPAADSECVVSGWGPDSMGELRSAQMQILSTCNNEEITDRMMCAGTPDGDKNACDSDAGGPLVCNDVLAGVVWGWGCDDQSVFSKVAAVRDWIREQSGV